MKKYELSILFLAVIFNYCVSILTAMTNTGEIILHIEKPLFGGSGLGYSSGKAVFVPFAMPGETVRALIISDHRDYIEAELKEILALSTHRLKPECPNFGICGGCNYLQADYDFELEMKRLIIADGLRRIAGFEIENPGAIRTINGRRFRYRSHCDVKFSGGKPGFFKAQTNTIVPFPDNGCLLLPDELNHAVITINKKNGSCRIAMDCKGGIHFQGDGSSIHEFENGINFDRGIGDFFQVNRYLRAKMQDEVLRMSELSAHESFLDIGCGIGFFSLFLARHFEKGIGIERDSICTSWAVHNAESNKIDNIIFHAMDANDIHPERHHSDFVVIDPPRSGISMKSRNAIITMSPDSIVYVSCNPATFSRDIKTFFEAGYSLWELALIDMFPGTLHIEIIGQLKR